MAERYGQDLNSEAQPILYGQDWNDEAYAVCKFDMLIKGQDAENIKRGDSLTEDGFDDMNFGYMLANPPFGLSWKQQVRYIEDEHEKPGYDGRFWAGNPRVTDGSLLFLQHMLSRNARSCGCLGRR